MQDARTERLYSPEGRQHDAALLRSVRINATRDDGRLLNTASQLAQDVFVAPDGKTLVQGVCNQNPGNYLQNLQNVALMNRDRNAMLAGNQQHLPPLLHPTVARLRPTCKRGTRPRCCSHSIQQSIRRLSSLWRSTSWPQPVPSLRINPALPSPTWQGQSANGEAKTGQTNSGPFPTLPV